jgi:hypothetical protein
MQNPKAVFANINFFKIIYKLWIFIIRKKTSRRLHGYEVHKVHLKFPSMHSQVDRNTGFPCCLE